MSVISEEPRVGFIIKHKTQKGSQQLTFWRSQISTISRLWQSEVGSYPPTEEPRIGIISRLETHQGTAATHILESQGQASSAGLKHLMAQQPLTPWRAKDSHCQQAWNIARHSSHSHSRKSKIGLLSRFSMQWGMATTHPLERRIQHGLVSRCEKCE